MNRNKIQKKNIFFGMTFKGLSIFLNFVLVPILIFFLGKVEYGVWITVFSITNWIFTFDLGIGQGLRNKLTESLSENNSKKASKVISTAYIFISIFSLVLLLLGALIISFIDFQSLFNYYGKSSSYLQDFVFLSLIFTILNFILSLYKKLYLAIHKSYFVELINVFFQTLFLVTILLWSYFELNESLINLILIYGLINFFVSIFATFVFFKLKKIINFSFKNFSKKEGKSLFGLGGQFFIINISLLVILSTDNLIISKMLGPEYVTDYSTIQKVFQFLIVIFTVFISSSWSLYSEALFKKDYNWIRANLKKMKLYYLVIVFLGVVLFVFIQQILNIWIGEDVVSIPKGLALTSLLYSLVFCFTNIYMFFINATNKISIQMYLYVFGAIINIPLSIYLVNLIGTSTGVILATIICVIPLLIVMPIQANFLLKKLETKTVKNL